MTIKESVSEDSEIKDVILRMGGFHTQMSFLGAIGHSMGGSGLKEVFVCVYDSNTVTHILSGKWHSRWRGISAQDYLEQRLLI